MDTVSLTSFLIFLIVSSSPAGVQAEKNQLENYDGVTEDSTTKESEESVG